MACGIGACQSCVCETWTANGAGKQGQEVEYRLVCKDGPVFRAEEVVWGD
ncbi:MAG: hypothetical protein M0038_20900 [Pseudomonadota bacterium]|nr:hypothetical protein [Pseudomonadota bacterium]